MNEFTEIMKKKSNLQLIEIIEYRTGDYHPDSVLVAKQELFSRKLNEFEIKGIREELDAKINLNRKKVEKLNETKNQFHENLEKTIDMVNPTSPKSDESIIKLVALFFAILFFLELIIVWNSFNSYYAFSFVSLENIIPIILIPIGIYGLIKTRKYGWSLIVIFTTYQIISSSFSLFSSLRYYIKDQFSESNNIESDLIFLIENEFLDNLNPINAIPSYIVNLLIFGSIFWFMNKINIKEKFIIKKEIQLYTIVFTIIPTIVFWLYLINS